MEEIVKIDFYKISKCGYYRYGQEEEEFCDLEETLMELKLWAFDGQKPLAETCTYQTTSELLRTFCFDMLRSGDDFF